MGTATWSVITNPSAAGTGTITCLRVILAEASSTIREGGFSAFYIEIFASHAPFKRASARCSSVPGILAGMVVVPSSSRSVPLSEFAYSVMAFA